MAEKPNDEHSASTDGYPSRDPVRCTECDELHDFPVPKFAIGQRVRIIESARGYHHKDRVGDEFTIGGIQTFLVMPCDEVEYFLQELARGAVLESRLEPAD